MRHPFWIDRLSPQERATVRRWYAVMGSVYAAVAFALVALIVAPRGTAEDFVWADATRRPAPALLVSDAAAAEPSVMARCARRELTLITDIERAGESQAVPGEQVYRAFVTMLDARALCAAGRLDDALALYDKAAIEPVQSAAK
jgi:hypothetical protein